MPNAMDQECFIRLLTEHQFRLHGYIYSLIGDHHRAADVLQETNIVLWRKAAELKSADQFLFWALAIARFQVLAHLRDCQRDNCLLDAELADLVSDAVTQESMRFSELQTALRGCLQKLAPHGRGLIEQRYFRDQPIKAIAEAEGRSVEAIKVALLRVRRSLEKCVRRRMAAEEF